MKYLDTSALVRAWRLGLAPQGVTRPHSVAEFYATLTRGLTVPLAGVKTRVTFPPAEVATEAERTFARVKFAEVSGGEALKYLKTAAEKNVQAANVHDLFHAQVAEREGCPEILTTNEKHFKLLTKLKLSEPTPTQLAD